MYDTYIDGKILSFQDYSNWFNISFLQLYDNEFSSSISEGLCDLAILNLTIIWEGVAIRNFDISLNKFNGTAPQCLWKRIFYDAPSCTDADLVLVIM